ncbi:MAG: SDR family NAD(P)-dependent oxidoreductase [Chitinophagales bacterium]
MIFVTGGTGFLGTHLLRGLVKRDEKVRALKRSSAKILLEAEAAKQIEWVEGDVLDVTALEQVMKGCDKLYHCAGLVSFLPDDHKKLMKANVEGTANVVNAALAMKITKLLHVSSVAALGSGKISEVITEKTGWDANNRTSDYAVSKFLGEREVWRGIAEGLNAVIINPSVIIGDGNWKKGSARFFSDVWNGLRFFSAGGTGFTGAKDVVNIMVKLMESDIHSERFIINSENLSIKEFLFSVADQLKKTRPSISIKPWMMEFLWREEMMKYKLTGILPVVTRQTAYIISRRSFFDNSKVVKATGYQFTSVSECLEETAKKILSELKY